ncbi:MAG: protoporphyrinogen oxidase [Chloroflexi bacterium]|nr:protoporphyrinogen oxidase [Chloroflexota bacterium]
MRLTIIGGGITGLSAAYYASRTNSYSQITLLEADSRWGGKIATERIPFDGGYFIVEGGPDTFLATKPWGVALCKELGLSERLHGTNPHKKNTYVLHKGRLLPLPDGLAMMIPSDVPSILRSRLLSWTGKARMGLDFILPAKNVNGDESLGTFISRRLGREAYENLIEPLMSGIYAGDGDQLSLASTFPYLRDLELKYGSLARGALKMRQQSNGKMPGSRSAFLTPTTGLAEIVEALVESLKSKVNLRLNARVISVTRDLERGTWNLQLDTDSLITDSLILATPAHVSGRILASFDPELASALQSIPYASTATVSLAYRLSDLPRDLDGYGYVIPRREGRKALACTWTSTKFPHRAPEGYALIRVFIGRAGQPLTPCPSPTGRWVGVRENRDESDLLAIAKEELRLTLGITAEPLLSRVFLWENAMPQYNLGHPELLKRIDAALEKYPSLALAGNGYRGIGIPDCIRSGELAVKKITESRGVENSLAPTPTAL